MISSASYICRGFILNSASLDGPRTRGNSGPMEWPRAKRLLHRYGPARWPGLSRRRRLLLFRAIDRNQATNDEEDTEGIEEDADRAEIAAEYGVATDESDCDDDRAPEDALHERASWFEELPM